MDSQDTPAEAPADTNQAVVESTAVDAVVATTEVAKPDATQPTEAKPEDAKTEVKAEVKAPEVPEAYADFTAPEGMQLDTDVLGDLKALGKELNLTQENAQKVFDLGVKLQQRNAEAWQAQMQKWVGEVKADKEIGGDKLVENLGFAKKAVEQFGGKELMDYLDSSGLGDHPSMVRAFYRIGKAISDDSFVPGGKNTGTARSLEQRLYGNKTA
jgi:hypothetical protein